MAGGAEGKGKADANPPMSGHSCPCPKPFAFPPLPGKHPNLFLPPLALAREIPPCRDQELREQAGRLSAAPQIPRSRPRAQVLAPLARGSFIRRVLTLQPAPRPQRCFPGELSRARRAQSLLAFKSQK